MKELNEPMNANERFLYAIAVRLDAIIEQNNSIIDAFAKEKEVAVVETKVESVVQVEPEVKAPVKRTRKKVE